MFYPPFYLACLAVLTALSGAPRSASSCLGTHLSPKLCFARRDLAMAPRFPATQAKQSFEDTGMPKQELGNEMQIPDDDAEPSFDLFDQRPTSGQPVEIPRADGTILVLDPG